MPKRRQPASTAKRKGASVPWSQALSRAAAELRESKAYQRKDAEGKRRALHARAKKIVAGESDAAKRQAAPTGRRPAGTPAFIPLHPK